MIVTQTYRFGLTALALLLAVAASSPVRAEEPFANVNIRFEADCPFACDSFVLVLEGEYPSSNWQPPHLQRVDFTGTAIIVYMNINYESGVGLPMLTPFELRVPHGPLPVGRYTVGFSIGFFGEPVPLPNRLLRDTITIGAPGDINCDRRTDIVDVVTSINQTLRNAPPPDPPERGDLTCDSRRDVLDVIQSIQNTFRAGTVCTPCDLNTPPLVITDTPAESLAVDTFVTMDVQLAGDSLRVRFAYAGGCLTHHYAIIMSPSTFEGDIPRIAHLYPVHHDHHDSCEAYVIEWVTVGLERVVESYKSNHPGDGNSMILRVHEFNPVHYVDLVYNFD